MQPALKTEEILALEDEYSVPTYAKWPVAFVKGQDCIVVDSDGAEYLDLYGGHCVAIVGHAHPRWVFEIHLQSQNIGFYSNVAYSDIRARFLKALIEFSPAHLDKAFLCSTGSEANETAIKLAMKATGRNGIVALEGSFHGRTAGSLSVTHLGRYREQFPAVVRDTVAVAMGDIPALEGALSSDTAAVILEPVQSMNGVRSATPAYYRDLVRICHQNGTLVIFDEIQTGLGRLGAPFAADLFEAKVDIITLAKGLGGGLPSGAVLTTSLVSETARVGEQGTTFGGGPLAAAASNAVLEIIQSQDLVANAAAMERYAREHLVVGPVTGIRGRGLLLGLETSVPAKDIARYLFEQKILVGTSADPHVVRLMPPLTVTQKHFNQLGGALKRFGQTQQHGE